MTDGLPQQLPLALRLDDGPSLDNFHCAPGNARLLGYLRDFVTRPPAAAPLPGTVLHDFLWLCGTMGAGKTHLLQALSRFSREQGGSACHISFSQCDREAPVAPASLSTADLVTLDDVEAIVGRSGWERLLFNLYNDLAGSSQRRLIIACALTPQQLAGEALAAGGLPDLYSRWQTAVVMPVRPLSDDDKRAALQLRARGLGLTLGDDALQFLLSRSDRGMHSLLALLDALDQHSLATQRRLTVPLIKSLTGW